MNIDQLISQKLNFLQQKGIETSRLELRMLIGFVLGIDPNDVRFYKQELTEQQMIKFDQLIQQRSLHCPVDKIIGQKGFYKYDFVVNSDVLSPRFDTEIVVENALELLKLKASPQILELGIGSGCILLSLLAELPTGMGQGIDISAKALKVAQTNAKKLGVFQRLHLEEASWFDEDFWAKTKQQYDLIVSNPPYIPSQDLAKLDREVKDYDPLTALDGGADGLRDYRQIAKLAQQLLKDEGYLLFEAGYGQAEDIKAIGQANNLKLVKIVKDLNHIERCIILKK